MAQQLGQAYIQVTADFSQLGQQLAMATQQVTQSTRNMMLNLEAAKKTSKTLFSSIKSGALGVVGSMISASTQGEQLSEAFGKLSQFTIDKTIGPALETIAGAIERLVANMSKFGVVEGFEKTFSQETKVAIVAVAGAILGALIPSFIGLTASLKAMAIAAWSAMAPLLPWMLAGAAVAAVAYLIWQNWDTVSGWLQAAWNWLWTGATTIFNGIVETIKTIWNGITTFFSEWGMTILAVITGPIGWLVGLIVTYWDQIVAFTTTIWNGIISFFQEWGTTILTVLTLPFWILVAFFQEIWALIDDTVKSVWNGIVAFFTTIWQAIVNLFTGYLNWVLNTFTSIWNKVKEGVILVWNAIRSFLSSVWNAIVGFFAPIWNRLVSTITSVWDRIKSITMSVWNTVKGWLSNIWNSVKNTASSIWNGVTSAITGAWESLKSKASSIWEGIFGSIKKWINKALDIVRPFINGFNSVVSKINSLTGAKLPTLSLPGLAKGGIVTSPTMAVVGEGRYSEAVLPLSNKTFSALAEGITSKMAGVGGGNGFMINVEQMHVRNDQDIRLISQELWRLHQRQARSFGGRV
ncbi:hypothetical protein ADL26_06185 [Thermoactinomyces vulgaris]|nr:hypothetical protein ADL26_06185 [Thermoactinomyces vulgaris]